MSEIAENAARVCEKIAAAAKSAGRSPEDITLVAVSKRQTAAAAAEALTAGLTQLGENYVQEAADKRALVTGGAWHLIGHLQSNKAKLAVTLFDLIQSVDSLKLAREIGRQAQAIGKTQAVLLQVHLGDEETKTGVPPEAVLDTVGALTEIKGLDLRGLMGVPPLGTDPRPFFVQARTLFEQMPPANRQTLSLGMSGDYEAAIEEGATLVRVGTALFGARQ